MVDLSDTPAGMIARMDAAISRRGQTITLRRGTTVQTCKAVVRGYEVEKITGTISVADRHVIVSPTGLGDFGIPHGSDEFLSNGRPFRVQGDVNPIYVDDVLVRVEMRVRLA
jgi:hypothetical protein